MRYDSIANDVSKQTGIPVDILKLIYKKLFTYMRDKVREFNIKDLASEEEFLKDKNSFNIQHLGKIYIGYYKASKYKEYYDSKGDTADVQQSCDNGG